jgi:hypothetical protein
MKILFVLSTLISILFADLDDEWQWAVENFTYHFDIDNDGKKDTITQQFQKVDMRNAENHIVIKATSGDNLEYDEGSFTYYKFQSCGKGCIKVTDGDWGIWGEIFHRYYYYDPKRRSWFLKKEILEAPHFDEPNAPPTLYKRDTEVTYYDRSKRIDGKIMPILKDNALKKLLHKLKNRDTTTLNSIEEGYLSYYLQHIPLTKKNIWIYNNIAYYLQGEWVYYQQKLEGIYLLKKIIKFDPNRAVAYLNLADVYHQIDEENLSKQSYKQYINLMKKQNREKKIPKRVIKMGLNP